jgi:hypothetical protein
MGYLGYKPADKPLTAADITDSIITSAKIVDGTIVNADINASAAIVSTKLSGVQGKFESALLHVRDEKSAGTDGGAFTSGSFQTRTLNTVMTNEISGASLSSNQIILPSGTYYIEALAPAVYVDRHKTKLRNITDSTDTLIGTTESTGIDAVDYNSTTSFVRGRFTITAQKTFELQHRAENTLAFGFGYNSNFGVVEVYADVQIWKVA